MISAGLVAAALIVAGCATTTGDSARQKASINSTLIGMNLTYYSIAGVPMSYTIAAGDITSIEPATYNDSRAWKVRVGRGLNWSITMDESGTRVLDLEQLFRT